MEINKFITGPVTYDKAGSQYFFVKEPNGNDQIIAEMRGWGSIQNMFDTVREAELFQDKLGDFIAEAINEKMNRDKLNSKK